MISEVKMTSSSVGERPHFWVMFSSWTRDILVVIFSHSWVQKAVTWLWSWPPLHFCFLILTLAGLCKTYLHYFLDFFYECVGYVTDSSNTITVMSIISWLLPFLHIRGGITKVLLWWHNNDFSMSLEPIIISKLHLQTCQWLLLWLLFKICLYISTLRIIIW